MVRFVSYTGLYYAAFGVARLHRNTGVVKFDWHRGVCHPSFREWRDATVDALLAEYPAGHVFVHDVLAASPVVAFTVGFGSDFVMPWQACLPAVRMTPGICGELRKTRTQTVITRPARVQLSFALADSDANWRGSGRAWPVARLRPQVLRPA